MQALPGEPGSLGVHEYRSKATVLKVKGLGHEDTSK